MDADGKCGIPPGMIKSTAPPPASSAPCRRDQRHASRSGPAQESPVSLRAVPQVRPTLSGVSARHGAAVQALPGLPVAATLLRRDLPAVQGDHRLGAAMTPDAPCAL